MSTVSILNNLFKGTNQSSFIVHMKNFVLLLFHAFKELLTVVSSADSSLLYI